MHSELELSLASPSKRPTGRSLDVPWLRRGMRAATWISPQLAAVAADQLFFRPSPKVRQRPAELEALARGREFRLRVGRDTVTGWAFGEGPAVVLSHGWAGYAGQMTALVPAITAAGFRALAVDMPGHGRSTGKTSSVVHFARTLLALQETFGALAGAVGHSLGAGGITFALGHGLKLDRAVFFAPPGDFEIFWSRFREGLGISPDVWTRMKAIGARRLGVPYEEVQPLHFAPALSTRLLVFHDTADREVPIGSAEALVNAWPGAELIRTSGLGHVRLLKEPTLAKQAADFLAGAQPARATG